MPKQVKAQAAQDEQEERQVGKLARSHHAPADWKFHAQMVLESWAGKTPNEIAAELGCHPQTVRIHLARFNAEGITGLGTKRERYPCTCIKNSPPLASMGYTSREERSSRQNTARTGEEA